MPEQMIMERLVDNLSRLRLPRIGSILSEMTKTAETESWSYLTLLDRLIEEEVAQKEQRRIERALKVSGLPYAKQ
jgi:DNA replication protein DnaC